MQNISIRHDNIALILLLRANNVFSLKIRKKSKHYEFFVSINEGSIAEDLRQQTSNSDIKNDFELNAFHSPNNSYPI